MRLYEARESELAGALDLLEQAFPRDERRDRDAQARLFLRGEIKVYIFRRKNAPAALMTVWALDGLVFLEHFAVHENLRGAGLGGQMLEELSARSGARVVLEAEDPRAGELAARRVRFYERHGFSVCPCEYIQPPYREGGAWVPMLLMARPGIADPAAAEQIKNTLHGRVYGINHS